MRMIIIIGQCPYNEVQLGNILLTAVQTGVIKFDQSSKWHLFEYIYKYLMELLSTNDE